MDTDGRGLDREVLRDRWIEMRQWSNERGVMIYERDGDRDNRNIGIKFFLNYLKLKFFLFTNYNK